MRTSNISSRINDIINDAVNTMDFGRLSGDINSMFRDSVSDDPDDIRLSDERGDGFSDAQEHSYDRRYEADQGGQGAEPGNDFRREGPEGGNRAGHAETGYRGYGGFQPAGDEAGTIPVDSKPPGTYSGPVMIACGIIGIAVFGLSLLVIIGINALLPFNMLVSSIVLAGLTGACGFVTAAGVRIRKRMKRFKEYLHIMDNAGFYEIRELAQQVRKNDKYVKSDLNKMINTRMFPEGHIDDSGKCFIGSNSMYRKYMEAKESYEKRSRESREEDEKRAGETEDERKLRLVLEKGNESIRQIREANEALPGEEISRKLDELEHLISQIFKRVEEKPALLPDIRKFMDYYLPTTVKLVNVYTDFENKPVQTEEIKKARLEIEQTLDTIEAAFRKLLSELYEDTVMDVSTDISVLKNMFARDGLADSDFK